MPSGLKEHVALAEQALSTDAVEDHARVGHRLETAKAIRLGTFRLDMPVITSTEGRWVASTVDADSARLLRQPNDRVLDRLRADHHQVGELVDDDEQVGKRLFAAGLERPVRLRQVAARTIESRS